MVWKILLSLTLRGGHSFSVQILVWRRRQRWYDGVGRCAVSGSGPCTWYVLYFHLFLESFVIGFANEFHRLLSKKKGLFCWSLYIFLVLQHIRQASLDQQLLY
jgi:hypothetical protein